jgi:hypothetical protein
MEELLEEQLKQRNDCAQNSISTEVIPTLACFVNRSKERMTLGLFAGMPRHSLKDKLTLYPGCSLVNNISSDSLGTHTKYLAAFQSALSPVRLPVG